MKALILFLFAIFPANGLAQEGKLLSGEYSRCVKWTTFNDVETSRKHTLVAGDSMEFRISFYYGSGTCAGEPEGERVYRDFYVLEDFGSDQMRITTVQDRNSRLYFRISLSEDLAMVFTLKSLDEDPNLMQTIFMDRVN